MADALHVTCHVCMHVVRAHIHARVLVCANDPSAEEDVGRPKALLLYVLRLCSSTS
jgi:hypothetical protein